MIFDANDAGGGSDGVRRDLHPRHPLRDAAPVHAAVTLEEAA